MTKIVRIHTETGMVEETPCTGDALLLGGRRLTSMIVAREVPPACEPLGRHNKLVFACGPLAGTLVSSANRLSIGAKSPLTGTIKESNAGGTSAYMMGKLDIRGLVLEGKPTRTGDWKLVYVGTSGVRLESAADLAGLTTTAKAEALFARFGRHIGMSVIGPVGERLGLLAGIANVDPEGVASRYNGRGGLGAVMASKGILAVVFDASEAPKVNYANKAEFMALNRQVAQSIKSTPQTADSFRNYGTAAMIDITQALGALPTRNFSTGAFEGYEKITSQVLHDTIVARKGEGSVSHACMTGCLIQCSNIFPDAQGRVLCSPLEYENMGLLGSNLCIDSLDDIAKLNTLCNELGCDTIEMGAALGVAMEMGLATFGDAQSALKLMDEVSRGTPLGCILAAGAKITGQVFGCAHVPVVKGQAMPAYDPRAMKGLGVTYATSTQCADHTAGNTARAKVKQHMKEGKVELSKNAQRNITCFDNLGVCIMLSAAISLSTLAALVEARYGIALNEEIMQAQSRELLQLEHQFNLDAGITLAHDCLPEFFTDELNPANGASFDLTAEEMSLVHA